MSLVERNIERENWIFFFKKHTHLSYEFVAQLALQLKGFRFEKFLILRHIHLKGFKKLAILPNYRHSWMLCIALWPHKKSGMILIIKQVYILKKRLASCKGSPD